jgi:DNA-binding response OmpR family regulator
MARVLVVDDEENQLRVLAMGLRLEGFDVATATSAEQAMTELDQGTVDIVVVDLMMPGTNGIELARQLRERHPETRVILTSAYHLSERQLERADCGVVGFVPKPYALAELADFLRAKLATSRSSLRMMGARLVS